MDKMKITGGRRLSGTVQASGSKNAALPCLISSLLTEEKCLFTRVPALEDIRTTLKLLHPLGAEIGGDLSRNEVLIQVPRIASIEAPYDLVRTMRASVLVLGPLVARHRKARVSLPGGCAIGTRPIDLHLQGLETLGAKITLANGYVEAEAPEGLRGGHVKFAFPSVGATENLLMAASLARGETILENVAREPEIEDLAKMLRAMGAGIEGEGTSTIRVKGREKLQGCKHEIMGDRIEAGTLLIAGLITGGEVTVSGIEPRWLEAVLTKLEEAGAGIRRGQGLIEAKANWTGRPRAVDLTTEPFPGFPTDMQAQFMALLATAEGESTITETIFENRFQHVPELSRLGADISVEGSVAKVRGKGKLLGAPVMATDLRASASLILAALVSEGETIVNRIYHLDRGYEKLEKKLQALGANVERLK